MYESNDLPTSGVTYRSGSRRRWLAVGAGLAAVLVVLALIVLTLRGGGDQPGEPLGAASSPTTRSPEPTAEPTEDPGDTGGEVGPNSGGGGGDPGSGGEVSEGSGDSEEEPEQPEEPEPPAEPLTIEATIDTVSPGNQCFASGTIAVSGGDYPLTVHYQWRTLVIAGGLDGEPVSAVHNVTFTEPGEAGVQTNALPEDGTNVFLVVSGPEPAGSGVVGYDGCSDGPGDIIGPGD